MFILHSSFFIEHVYGCVDLIHCVYVLERVHMRALSDLPFFQRFILMFFWVRVWAAHSFFVRGERLFLRVSRSFLYPSFHPFLMWLILMLWCRLTITHTFFFMLSFIFIPLLHFILSHLISLFSHLTRCSTWVHHPRTILPYPIDIWYVHSFIFTICLGIPKSSTHEVFCALHLMHEGYEDCIIKIIEHSFLSFLHPITLAYVTSRILRPP